MAQREQPESMQRALESVERHLGRRVGGGGSGREQLESMYGHDTAAMRRTDVPPSSLPFGRGAL